MSRSRSKKFVVGVALAGLLVTVLAVAAQAREGNGKQVPIGMLEIFVNAEDHQVADGKIRVFVPSSAGGAPCLATIQNSNYPAPGTTLLCGNPDERDGVAGVTITLLTQSPMPADAWWHIAFHQDLADTDPEGDRIVPVIFP